MVINERMSEPIKINSQPVKNVKEFTYIGSIISDDNGAKKDIKTRLVKVSTAFCKRKPIWRSMNIKTKLKIFNSNVKSVLLYDSETERLTESRGFPQQLPPNNS